MHPQFSQLTIIPKDATEDPLGSYIRHGRQCPIVIDIQSGYTWHRPAYCQAVTAS